MGGLYLVCWGPNVFNFFYFWGFGAETFVGLPNLSGRVLVRGFLLGWVLVPDLFSTML